MAQLARPRLEADEPQLAAQRRRIARDLQVGAECLCRRRLRDCARSDAIAAVMQVRPLSVVSGTADSSPFGQSPFGDPGWL